MLGILDTLLYPGNFQHKLTLKKILLTILNLNGKER